MSERLLACYIGRRKNRYVILVPGPSTFYTTIDKLSISPYSCIPFSSKECCKRVHTNDFPNHPLVILEHLTIDRTLVEYIVAHNVPTPLVTVTTVRKPKKETE